jgi:hypothetical protein
LNDIILDPDNGFASQKGFDAIANRGDYLKKFQKAVNDAGANLTNDDQRLAFHRQAVLINEEGFRHAVSHEYAQKEDASRAQFQGAADQIARTVQNPNVIVNPAEVEKQLTDLRRLATAEGVRRFGNDASAVASVVGPAVQKGALDAMEAAIATQNPTIASSTFDKVGQYLGVHEHTYGNFVRALQTKQQVKSAAANLLAGSSAQVVMPGGQIVSRLDSSKLATGVAALPVDTPNLEDIVKLTEQQEQVRAKLWNQSVATVVDRVKTAGTDPATGAFSLAQPAVSAYDREWLRLNAPQALIDLGVKDARAQRAASGDDKRISAGNYNDLTAQLIDPARRKPFFGQMTPEEFRTYIGDESKFPGGFTDLDEKRALQQFKKLKDDAGKLEEPVPKAVTEVLKAAFPNDPNGLQQKKFTGMLHDAIQGFVDEYQAAHKGVAPDSAVVRKFAEAELVKGSVTDVGKTPGLFDFNSVTPARVPAAAQVSGQAVQPGGGRPGGNAPRPAAGGERSRHGAQPRREGVHAAGRPGGRVPRQS